MHAEVIAIGDELTSGQRLDTNSRWLSAELGLLGIPVVFHTTTADTLEAGVEAFRIATGRADIVVATGGLGPTADDLTRDVLATLGHAPLELSADALAAVESRFARRGAVMPESNRRQALFPRGSRIIPNPDGTAPGIDMDIARGDGRRSRVFALPGVPGEMKTMWEGTVGPALLQLRPDLATIVHRRIKCFGAGESAIEALLPDLIRRGREPLVGITAHEATITLRITARAADEAACTALIAPTEAVIRQCLGELVYGIEDDEVEDAVVRLLLDRGLSLATCEIGTTGRVAELLAEAHRRAAAGPGAAGGFAGGIVLGDDRGAATATELATRARAEFGAAIGLGIAAPRSNAEGRMLLDVAVVAAGGQESTEHICGGAAAIARSRAAKAALDLVRRGRVARLGKETVAR